AWLCIEISQGSPQEASTVTMLWIVALPLYELIWSTIRRIIRGVSPFEADNNHFHHLLLKAGFGVRGTFVIFVGLAMLFAGFGLFAQRVGLSDPHSFLLLTVAGIGVVRLMYRADILRNVVPRSLRRIPPVASQTAPGDPGTAG
ncbi:MAG: hypothetical protein ACRES3_00445, partial [Steroidobacteraceae bacterium]